MVSTWMGDHLSQLQTQPTRSAPPHPVLTQHREANGELFKKRELRLWLPHTSTVMDIEPIC